MAESIEDEDAPVRLPDLSARPFHLTIETLMKAAPAALYHAWTEALDRWLAAPGSLLMTPRVNAPFFFEAAGRRPHYGRFLRLERDRVVELTWVTGEGGTEGAETIVTVELERQGRAAGTLLRLMHAGFRDQRARDLHHEAWPLALEQLESYLGRPRA